MGAVRCKGAEGPNFATFLVRQHAHTKTVLKSCQNMNTDMKQT